MEISFPFPIRFCSAIRRLGSGWELALLQAGFTIGTTLHGAAIVLSEGCEDEVEVSVDVF